MHRIHIYDTIREKLIVTVIRNEIATHQQNGKDRVNNYMNPHQVPTTEQGTKGLRTTERDTETRHI